jgi:hypothetical protein
MKIMTRPVQNCLGLLLGLVHVLCLGVAVQAAPTLWNGGGNGTTWSDSANWSAGTPNATSNVQFNAVVTNSNTTMDLGNFAIASYEQPRIGGTHQLNLGSSTLTSGSLLLSSEYSQSGGGSAYLTVNGSAGSALNVTGLLSMSQGRGRLTSLTMKPNVALNIGSSPSNRGELSMIQSTSTSHAQNKATLTAGKVFNAYVTNLYAGAEITDLNGDSNNSIATLDLSAVTSGTIDVAQSFLVGDGYAMTGTMTVSDGIDIKIGINPTNRGAWRVASGGAKKETFTASSLTLGTGSVQAYLTDLDVAYATGISVYASADNFSATGTLDASQVSSGFIDVAGAVRVGTVVTGTGVNTSMVHFSGDPNYAPRAIGTLKLSAIDVNSDSLQVGDANNRIIRAGVAGNIGRGTLELDGTRFSVRDTIIVDGFDAAHAGVVSIDVLGESAGLMLGSAATLAVGNGSIDITFLAPGLGTSGDYFGLSWQGNHLAELLALGSKLTWHDTAVTAAGYDAVSIYYRNGFTYVGTYIVPAPEPTSGLLLALGVLVALRRRHAT